MRCPQMLNCQAEFYKGTLVENHITNNLKKSSHWQHLLAGEAAKKPAKKIVGRYTIIVTKSLHETTHCAYLTVDNG